MPTLDLRHLMMLDAIAASRTLAEAADRLNISPSALSHRVQEAERRLGRPLLASEGRGRRLTMAGERLVQAARACIRELDVAEHEAGSSAGEVRHRVTLGASTLSGYEWLPGLLARLQASHGQIDLEVVMDASVDPLSALRERRIDVAVVPARARVRGLAWVRLFQDEMVALVAASHPARSRRHIEVRELVADVYIADNTQREPGREFEQLFEPAGIRPGRVQRAGHMAAVVSLVRAGLGVTICTRTSAAPFMAGGGLALLRIGARGHFITWHAAIRSGGPPGAPGRVVAEALADGQDQQ
jgi:LysR family transcriptional regulator for metE and metH